MAAYVVIEIEITDPVVYDQYKLRTPATIHAHGGKYLARGGNTVTLEGAPARRVVVLEFPSMERIQEWWRSPEFSAVKELRDRSAKARFIAIDGVETQPLDH